MTALFYPAISVLGAALSGCGFVLQQHAAEQVHDAKFLQLRLIARLIHKRSWLAGIGVMVLGYLIQAWVLGHLDLSVTEPLMTTSLIFALLLAVPMSGQALHKAEVIGAVLLTAGVAALSLTRHVKAPSESFGSFNHWPAAAVIAVVALLLVRLGRKRSGSIRATLTGMAAGLVLGIADAFTRRSVQMIDGSHPLHLLEHWPGYATVVASVIGLWLMQNAFSAAPLHASLPAVTAAEPAAGIVLGVVVFGDVIHISPLLVAVQLAGIVALVAGVILVARAPVFARLRLRELPHAALEVLHHLPEELAETSEPADQGDGTGAQPPPGEAGDGPQPGPRAGAADDEQPRPARRSERAFVAGRPTRPSGH
jgi:drug/metabolite transporter (DMT)-like permease